MIKKETKENILREAKTLFARKGFEGTSMADIAHEVGIEKASLYYFFKDKEQLFGDVVESFWRELADELKNEPNLMSKNISAKDFTSFMTKIIKTNLEAGYTVFRFNLGNSEGGRKAHRHVLYMRKRLNEVLKEQKVRNVSFIENLVVNGIQGYVVQAQLHGPSISPASYAKYLANLIFKKSI